MKCELSGFQLQNPGEYGSPKYSFLGEGASRVLSMPHLHLFITKVQIVAVGRRLLRKSGSVQILASPICHVTGFSSYAFQGAPADD